MSQLPNCPKCGSEYTYEDGNLYICPECANEWSQDASSESSDTLVVKDANGTILQDGDGTKIKGIRLVEGNDGHNIDCKVTGVGAIKLKQEFVKKS